MAADGEEMEGEEMAAPVGPSTLHMDLLVSTTGDTTLDGITIELEHVDAAREVKSVRQIWLDTTGVSKGVSATKALQVEIEDFEAINDNISFCGRFRYDMGQYLASLDNPPFLDVNEVLEADVFHVYNTFHGTNANIAAKVLLCLGKG